MTNINIFQMKKQLDDNKKLLEFIKGFLDNSIDNVYEKISEIETNEEQLIQFDIFFIFHLYIYK